MLFRQSLSVWKEIYAKEKAVSVSDAGIPATEVIEAQKDAVDQLPALESTDAPQKPADTDIPASE